jgi:transcriptional regulator with XRE-family HTH domain
LNAGCVAGTSPKLSDQIRLAVVECDRSRYEISRVTGISEASLSRFVNGERGLSIAALDVLAESLNLKIVARKPRGRKG